MTTQPDGDAPIPGPGFELVLVPADVLEEIAVTQAAARFAGAEPDPVAWPPHGTFPADLVETAPATRRLLQLGGDPDSRPWLVRAIVETTAATDTGPAERRIVGHLGGHGPPEDGVVEIGYTVTAAARRRGVATAAARTWFAWAHDRGATRARLSTLPDNVASRGVARRLGLPEVGGAWDEDDAAWELVHQGPLPLAPAHQS